MMRTLTAGLVLVAAIATTGLAPVQGEASREKDDQVIRGIVREYVAARDRNDPKAVAALFTEDADQLTSSGEWRRGRDGLVRGALASTAANAGRRTITIETIRYPAPSVAIADGRYTIEAEGGAPRRDMWTCFVLVKEGASWRITAIRNMAPAK